MKTLIKTALLLLISFKSFGQQSPVAQHGQIFCLSPVPATVNRVNGMCLGIGHNWSDYKPKTINGLNIEVNPATPIMVLFLDPDRIDHDSLQTTVNGLHLSTGGLSGNVKLNGAGVSAFNICYASNGFSVTGLYNVATTLKGVHISGLQNSAVKGRGLLIAAMNLTEDFKGISVGAYNQSIITKGLEIGVLNLNKTQMSGVQIGIFNKAGRCKGLQIGLWNMNDKRSFPFINW